MGSVLIIMSVEILQSELLLKICSNLSTQDLISLSQTCVRMYNHATDQTLWEHAFQRVPSYMMNEDPDLFIKLLNLMRFKRIRKIFLEWTPFIKQNHISELFCSLGQKTFLQEVYFRECHLMSVPTHILQNSKRDI